MKKIIQINLSGRAISIEEPAYEKLQQYILKFLVVVLHKTKLILEVIIQVLLP